MTHTAISGPFSTVEMRPLPMPLELPYGQRARIGLLALSTDLAVERDFHRMVQTDDIALFSTRIHLETPNSDRTFLALQDEIVEAAHLLIPDSRLDVVVFGCTAASTVIGPERIAALVDEARPGTHCTNPATATVAALRALNAKRIAVVTPYTRQMTGNVVRFLEEGGFVLTSVQSLGFDTDVEIGSIPAQAFVEIAKAQTPMDADAIFISCTGTKALDIVDALEQATGLPVVVSNQAAFWHALHLIGWRNPIHGFGKLLREGWAHQ